MVRLIADRYTPFTLLLCIPETFNLHPTYLSTEKLLSFALFLACLCFSLSLTIHEFQLSFLFRYLVVMKKLNSLYFCLIWPLFNFSEGLIFVNVCNYYRSMHIALISHISVIPVYLTISLSMLNSSFCDVKQSSVLQYLFIVSIIHVGSEMLNTIEFDVIVIVL